MKALFEVKNYLDLLLVPLDANLACDMSQNDEQFRKRGSSVFFILVAKADQNTRILILKWKLMYHSGTNCINFLPN